MTCIKPGVNVNIVKQRWNPFSRRCLTIGVRAPSNLVVVVVVMGRGEVTTLHEKNTQCPKACHAFGQCNQQCWNQFYTVFYIKIIKKAVSSVLSENVNYLVHIVHNDVFAIGALNTDDSEAIQSILSHRLAKITLKVPEFAERLLHDTNWF